MATVDRRTAVAIAAVAGTGGSVLAACSDGTPDEPPAETPAGEDAKPDTSSSAKTPDSSQAPNGKSVAVADVPEGGGLILEDPKVVITQPAAGEFKAFSSLCPHQGCPVTSVTDTITCPCHNSVFSIADGSVVSGPATSGLTEQAVTVDGDQLTLG